MKIAELRQKSIKELKELMITTKKELGEVSLNVLHGKEKNIKKAFMIRKDIARMLTLVGEKVSEEEK